MKLIDPYTTKAVEAGVRAIVLHGLTDEKQMVSVILHELAHAKAERDRAYNIAQDYVINSILQESGVGKPNKRS